MEKGCPIGNLALVVSDYIAGTREKIAKTSTVGEVGSARVWTTPQGACRRT